MSCVHTSSSIILITAEYIYYLHNISRAYFNADGIAIDWISDKLYFHDQCNLHIGVLDLANNLQKTLANHTSMNDRRRLYYTHIVVDPTTRYLIKRSIHSIGRYIRLYTA